MLKPANAVASFAPYTGPWTRQQAGHLLRRTTFAPLKTEIDTAIRRGLSGSIDTLFAPLDPPEPPVYYDYSAHPNANIGDTWVQLHVDPINRTGDSNARRRSVENWWFRQLATPGFNIRGKMCFFWHNHFGMEGPGSGRAIYSFISKYFDYATGNFRELVREMCIEPSMLVFLNGSSNTRVNPNENFAREILELFTVGKGPQVGDGDYTHYTEQDVTALARAFTGWRVRQLNSVNVGEGPEAFFQANRHDTGEKVLSHRFNNAVITNGDENEYSQVVDLIFQQEENSRHISRKLYRHFVYYEISDAVEADIIEPMAAMIREHDYEIGPALKALLSSQHFYEADVAGNMIKTPLDLVHSVFRLTDYTSQGNVTDDYQADRLGYRRAAEMGLELRKPPSVSGWTAYYQAPAYYRLWLNTATLQQRNRFFQQALRERGFFWSGVSRPMNWLAMLERYDEAFDPNAMISEMAEELLPQPLNETQLTALKDLLLPGLPDFVWSNEYADLKANPNDEALRNSVLGRLRALITGFFQLAEFQLH